MRQSRERVWSSSLELEALEQEVVRQSPDRGPRDLEVTAAAIELTTSAPAACVRACLHVGGSASVCARACLPVWDCACVKVGLSVRMGRQCVGVCLCVYMGGVGYLLPHVPVHVRPMRKHLFVCVYMYACM